MRKNMPGYTLIETLISIFFLAFCVLFIVSIFPTASTAVHQAENIEIASSVMNKELETINNAYFPSIAGYSGSYLYSGYRNGAVYMQNFIYNVYVNTTSPNLKDIVIIITWPEKGKPNQSLNMETLVFNI